MSTSLQFEKYIYIYTYLRPFNHGIIPLQQRIKQFLYVSTLIHAFSGSNHDQEAIQKHQDPPGQVSLNRNVTTLL